MPPFPLFTFWSSFKNSSASPLLKTRFIPRGGGFNERRNAYRPTEEVCQKGPQVEGTRAPRTCLSWIARNLGGLLRCGLRRVRLSFSAVSLQSHSHPSIHPLEGAADAAHVRRRHYSSQHARRWRRGMRDLKSVIELPESGSGAEPTVPLGSFWRGICALRYAVFL